MNFVLKVTADIFMYLTFSNFVVFILDAPLLVNLFILLVMPVIYVIYSLITIGEYTGHYEYAPTFFRFLKIFLCFAIFTMLIDREILETASLPFAILFFITAVILMRTTRHHDQIQKQMRFRLLNLLPLIFVLLAGLVVSTRQFLGISAWIISFIHNNIIVPIIQLLALIIAYTIGPILRLFITRESIERAESLEDLQYAQEHAHVELEPAIVYYTARDLTIFETALTIIVILFFIYLSVILFRKLTVFKVIQTEGIIQEYVPIEYEKAKKSQETGNLAQLRKHYRSFMQFCWKNGIPQDIHMTSADYEQLSIEKFDINNEAGELRNIYIPARYGGKEVTKADINHIKSLYSRIRKQGGKRI